MADARLVEPGWFARGLAWRPLHFIGTISYGIYLWHWPVIVYLNGARTGLSTWPLDLLRIAVTLAVSTASYYLVERPIRLANLRGGVRLWAPVAGVVTAVVIVSPPSRPSPIPPPSWGRPTSPRRARCRRVPGAGGYQGQRPIRLAPAPSAADPLRVMILGDSVMHDASYGISCLAPVHRRGHRRHEDDRRVRPHDGDQLADLHPQPHPPDRGRSSSWPSWSWDQYGPTTPNALHQPAQYTSLLRRAVSTMLTPGNGVEGVIFTQFPQSGDLAAANPADTASYNRERHAGVIAWNDIAEKMTADFPGRVMYFPLADSILLHGKYSAWLPPEGDPHAPSDQWIRVRKLDNVHLCPEGSARYADALLADMTTVFRLAPDRPGIGHRAAGPRTRTSTIRPEPAPTIIRLVRSFGVQEQAELLMMRSALAADFALAQLEPTLATTSYQ